MRIAALLVIVAAFSTSAYAQFDSGQITGFVRDPQQGALPGTTVTATNEATSNARTTVTNASGFYVFPEVPVGTYTDTVTATVNF